MLGFYNARAESEAANGSIVHIYYGVEFALCGSDPEIMHLTSINLPSVTCDNCLREMLDATWSVVCHPLVIHNGEDERGFKMFSGDYIHAREIYDRHTQSLVKGHVKLLRHYDVVEETTKPESWNLLRGARA